MLQQADSTDLLQGATLTVLPSNTSQTFIVFKKRKTCEHFNLLNPAASFIYMLPSFDPVTGLKQWLTSRKKVNVYTLIENSVYTVVLSVAPKPFTHYRKATAYNTNLRKGNRHPK